MSEENAAVTTTPNLAAPTMPAPHAGLPGQGTPSPGKGERPSVKRGRAADRAAAAIAELKGQTQAHNQAAAGKSPTRSADAGPLSATPGLAPITEVPVATRTLAETVSGGTQPTLEPEPTETKAEPAKDPALAEPEKTKEADDADERAKLEKQYREARRLKKRRREALQAAEADRNAVAMERQRLERAEREDMELRRLNPSAWLEKHGYDFREVAAAAVKRESETPEQKAVREAREEARLAREEAAALKREVEADKQRRDQERMAVRQAEAIKGLNAEALESYRDDKTEYPTLAAHYSDDEIAKAVTQVRIDHYKRTGREATARAALAHIEGNAKRERERFLRSQNGSGNGSERATLAPKGAETRAAVRPVTNRDSATTAGPPKPQTQRERRAEAIRVASTVLGRR